MGLNYWYKQDQANCANGTTGTNGQIQCIMDSVDSGRTVNYTYDALYRAKTAVTNGSTPSSTRFTERPVPTPTLMCTGTSKWGFSIDLWQSQMAASDQAGKLKDALKELLTNEDCAKWLGGQDRASDILGKFAGVKDVSPGSDWIPRGPSQMQAQADINSNRAIAMNDSRPGPGGGWNGSPFAVFAGAVFNHQSQPAQLTIVIHELAHVAWKGTPMGQFIDINNGLSSAFWISRDCGTAVPEWDNWKVPQ